MRITCAFDRLNDRRYSRPWGAIVTFPDGIKPKYDFCGHWDGGYKGGAGNVVIPANPGDVVAFGQKDNRGNNTTKTLYIVGPSGDLTAVSEAEAREYVAGRSQSAPAADPRAALIAERDRLAARLAEIEALLAR